MKFDVPLGGWRANLSVNCGSAVLGSLVLGSLGLGANCISHGGHEEHGEAVGPQPNSKSNRRQQRQRRKRQAPEH